MFKIDLHVENKLLYGETENESLPLFFPLFVPFFPRQLCGTVFSETVQARIFKLSLHMENE